MSKLEVILCESLENSLAEAIEKCPHDRLFILTDEHTHRLCLPQLQNIPAMRLPSSAGMPCRVRSALCRAQQTPF